MQAVGGTTLNADEAPGGATPGTAGPAGTGAPAEADRPVPPGTGSAASPRPAARPATPAAGAGVGADDGTGDGTGAGNDGSDPGVTRDAAPGFSPKAVGVLAGIAVIAVLVDQLTKEWATKGLTEGEPVRILGGLVHLSLLRNSGAAFSLGTGYTWIFPLITLVVVGWIGWMALRLRSVPWAVALGLVLGGALGNLGDRLFRAPSFLHGHVVDMISVFGPYAEHFPVFNIADSCLSVGVVLAVLLELTGRQRDGSRLGKNQSSKQHEGETA